MHSNRKFSISSFSAFSVALLSSCSVQEDTGSTGEGHDATPGTTASDDLLAELTPEYLAGTWCHVRFEFRDESSEENRTYEFATDGTLKYQNNPSTPVEKDGSYEVKDGALVIKPTLAMIPLRPKSNGPDEMTFRAIGTTAIWKRGACSNP